MQRLKLIKMNKGLLEYTKSDWIGIISSGLCLIHCNVSILFIVFGFQFSLNDAFNGWLDYIFLLISFCALYASSQSTKSSKIQIVFLASFLLFAIGILFHDDYNACSFLSIIGSIGLTATHIWNILDCKKCRKEE